MQEMTGNSYIYIYIIYICIHIIYIYIFIYIVYIYICIHIYIYSITDMCCCQLAAAVAHLLPVLNSSGFWTPKWGHNTQIGSPASKFVAPILGQWYMRFAFCNKCSCAWCQDAGFTVYVYIYICVYIYMYIYIYLYTHDATKKNWQQWFLVKTFPAIH